MMAAARYLAFSLLALGFSAQASLVLNNVHVFLDGDTLGTLIDTDVLVLDPGGPEASATNVALADGVADFFVDIGANGFVFDIHCDNTDFGCQFPALTLTLSGLSWSPEFGELVGIASIDYSTNHDPAEPPQVGGTSTTPTSVTIQWDAFFAEDTGGLQTDTFTVGLDVAFSDPPRATPAPASLWLLLPLLGLLGLARRRIA